MRKSLVVYGVSAVEREALSEGSEIEVTIAALIEDGQKAIAQIKGSYLKVKVKELKPGQVSVGDNIIISLKKVTKQKITGLMLGKAPVTKLDDKSALVEKLWESIEEEAQKDIQTMKVLA